MHAVGHAVGFQRLENGVPQGVPGGDVCKGQSVGGVDQAIEVGLQLDGMALRDAQAFPDGIAPLDHAVEHVDAGSIP